MSNTFRKQAMSTAQRGELIFVSNVFVIVKLFHCIVCKYSSNVKKKKSKKSNSVEIVVVSLFYLWRGGPVERKSPSTVMTAYNNTGLRIFICNMVSELG